MGIRDLFLFALLAFVLIRTPKAPYIGALGWVLFGVMNPHKLSYGAAFGFPFAQAIAIVLLLSLLVWRGHREMKGGAPGVALAALLLWCCITTPFSINLDASVDYLTRVLKTFIMTGVIMLAMHTRRHVDLLIWTLVLGVGFYGVKGGLFVLATGGNYMVNGPPGGVIEGNNALAVGLVATIPLMYYLSTQAQQRWVKRGLIGAMLLASISVLGSYSRGALLAIIAMGALFWLRGRNKFAILSVALVFVLIAIPMMPEQWMARMETTKTYDTDSSAMGRITAWETAYRIAVDRAPIGGGFEWQGFATSMKYSPDPTLVLVPHSIYFEVLGTQGFVGLALYLLFWLLVWWQCMWLRKMGAVHAEYAWARTLGSMVQVSLIGYAVGGAFLNLAFWEFCYYLYAAVAVACYVVKRDLAASSASASSAPQAPKSTAMASTGARLTSLSARDAARTRPGSSR
jgi:probable O-glycosylation ligase (exosortase A-associated)